MIYIATPYSHPRLHIRIRRYREAMAVCSILARESIPCYSPIVHWHPVELEHDLPAGHEFWKFNDCHMMDLCTAGLFVNFEGWNTSTGMAHELEYLRRQKKPIYQLDADEIAVWASTYKGHS